ncbi:hypothetical protein SBOR_3409 [Sclerotinia borealis F-4128]|uniref:Glucan 1, 4-alpha-glucosidase n=1 Tax=Sclerotinia borealis (strain F-4128) TaxID=1432307 RepID=W9CK63_SCLBF|nr:hypothetical protein SBOR_3409 [Sclerotinia borealis F-4128]
MDMDDPWGSPWADELKNDDGLGIRRIDNVADRNQVEKASEALRNNVNTTWGNSDDGFGDWEEDTGEKKGGLGLDGAAEQWDTPKRGGELEVVKDDVGALSPGWKEFSTSPARGAPKLSPSLLAKPAAIVREPSPDPWANAVPSNESATVVDNSSPEATRSSPEPIEEATEENYLEAFEAVVPQAESPGEMEVEPVEFAWIETVPEVSTGLDEDSEEPNVIGLGISAGESEVDIYAEDAEKEHHKADDAVLPSIQEPEHESSRPSSSPSDGSNHDGLLPESQRTSLDEEPKSSRITRAVPPRVQELVEHFDGLTEPEIELAVGNARVEEEANDSKEPEDEYAAIIKPENREGDKAEEDSNAGEPDDDDFGDFGDFEEGMSDDGEELVENHDSIKTSVSSELATPQNEPSEIRLPKRPSGPVEFSVDLTAVKMLFGEIEEKDDEAVEKIFIPDTIIADTFGSTEERKMWYRISRYGTMQKHNTGDDENYVRISWAKSQVKQDTQKIVGRWMEEDRNSGHVSLGGTSKGGSLFGWNDPNAPPVPLATVLGSKRKSIKPEAKVAVKEPVEVPREWPKGLARDRSRSKSRSSSKPREHSSTKSVESGTNVKVPLQPPVAQFGWASTPTMQISSDADSFPSTTGSFTKPPPLHMNSNFEQSRESSSALRSPALMSPIESPPSFLQAMKKSRPVSMPPPSTNSSNRLSANLAVVINNLNDGDDDDEWGEMVSSPVVTEAPKFPTQGLRHKKSMSLGTSLTNYVTLPNPQVTKLQSGFGHKSTSSLDNTHGNPKSPIISQSTLLSDTTIPSPISPNPSFADLWSTPAITSVPIQSTANPPPSPALSATSIANTSSQPVSPLPSNTIFTDTWSQPPPSTSSALTSSPPTTWSQPPILSIPLASTSTHDPWASADFSFFDAPAPAPAPTPTLLPRRTTTQRPQSYPALPKLKTVTFSTPPPKLTPPLPASVSTSHDSRTVFEMGQHEIVKKIVGNLPDLGYMFRR